MMLHDFEDFVDRVREVPDTWKRRRFLVRILAGGGEPPEEGGGDDNPRNLNRPGRRSRALSAAR